MLGIVVNVGDTVKNETQTRLCDITPPLRSGSQTLQDRTRNKTRVQEGGGTVEDQGEGRGARSMKGNGDRE